MSRRWREWAEAQEPGRRSLKLLLETLGPLATDGGEVAISQPVIAAQARCSKKTVHRGLRDLETAGFLRREARYRPDGSRKPDRIVLLRKDPAGSGGVTRPAQPMRIALPIGNRR